MKMFLRHRLVAGIAAALSGGAVSSALCFLLLQIDSVSLVGRGFVRTLDLDPGPYLPWIGMLLPLACLRARDRGKALVRIARAALPWLALFPLEFLPPSLLRIALMVFVLGWGVFRFGYLFGPVLPEQPVAPRKGVLTLCLIWAACALYGYWTQFEAHITLFFIYGDWSQYAEHYLALLSGQAPGRAWLAGAGHFNPLVNFVMTGCLALVRRPETIFLVNALLVSSAVPLAALLARKRGASPAVALCAALAAALNPALSHQYLGLMYGFHPVAFQVPLILGFLLLAKSRWKWACFAASLLVQETAAVFWAGYGLYRLVRRDWRTGSALCLAMPCWFFAIGHWVMPWALDAEQYSQMFHYAALGRNLWEAALSPILRPVEFWRAVTHPASITFVLCALVPLWFGWGLRRTGLIAVLPLFAGVCMQDSPQVKTIALQYSMEISVWLLALTAAAWGRPDRAPRWWRFSLPAGGAREGSIAGVLTATVFAYLLFGFAVPYGKYSVEWGRQCGDVRPMVEACLAGGAPKRVVATSRLRNHFLFRYPTVSISETPKAGDLVALELFDPTFNDCFELERRRAVPVFRLDAVPVEIPASAADAGIAAYRVGVTGEKTRLPVVSEAEFMAMGVEVPTRRGAALPGSRPVDRPDREEAWRDLAGIQARVLPTENGLTVAVRLTETPRCDADIVVWAGDRAYRRAFGGGALPAYAYPAGTVDRFTVPGDANGKIGLLIRGRPGSSAAFSADKEKK